MKWAHIESNEVSFISESGSVPLLAERLKSVRARVKSSPVLVWKECSVFVEERIGVHSECGRRCRGGRVPVTRPVSADLSIVSGVSIAEIGCLSWWRPSADFRFARHPAAIPEYRDGSNSASLSDQVDDGPMIFPALDLSHLEVSNPGPAEAAPEKQRDHGRIALVLKRILRHCLNHALTLF